MLSRLALMSRGVAVRRRSYDQEGRWWIVLDVSEVGSIIARMWQMHLSERDWLDRIGGYAKGVRGVPEVPENTGQEVKDLARLSVKNVLGLVVDSFAQNLSVTGYRTASAEDNDPAWGVWQANRMDARQALVYVPALTYGAAYVTVTMGERGPVLNPRSPKQILTAYVDPVSDEWPQYALEMWVTQDGAKQRRKAKFYDDTWVYLLDLGEVYNNDPLHQSATAPIAIRTVEDQYAHGATYMGEPVCPVVRFCNGRDADGLITGEIAPLIRDQQAINNVNFDRLIVSRFGAFPQKVITGWSGTPDEVAKASAMRVWAFGDPDVKATTLAAGSTSDYNAILDEMIQHVALRAQISPSQMTGKMINVSADALAAAEANQQRKLQAKRESFGESWEQCLRLAAEIDGDAETAADSGAEVVWRDTEARSLAAVVDAVTKLAGSGVPVQELLQLVPGMTQQQIRGIKTAMRGGSVAALVDKLTASPVREVPAPPDGSVTDGAGGS